MVKIEINGQVVEAHEGNMLIDVADDAQIAIPRFCYHKKLSIAANCRMCLVEVEGAPKALPACATPVTDGMKVQTKSAKAVAAQKSVMEFLLINHPLDCPICDQGGECELQDVAMEYGDDVSKYSEAKRILGDKDVGSLIHTDMTRCIHCTRCVRFGQEIGGIMELGATGRSEWMEIGTYIEKSITSEMSGNMIDLCPVGALTSKPFRYSARPWELKSHKGIAPHDSVGSHIIMHSKNNVIKRVVPGDKESINEIWISDRDRFSYEGLNGDDRLTVPMIKEKGIWKQVDWETALAFSADKLKALKSDAEEVGVLGSPSSTLEELQLLQKLARGLGFNNIDSRLRQQDFSLDIDGFIEPKLNHSFAEVEKIDSTLIVGSYLRKELPLLNHRLRKAQLSGKTISSINPKSFDINYDIATEIVGSDLSLELAGVAKSLEVIKGVESELLKAIVSSDAQVTIAKSLIEVTNSSIMIGQIAQMDEQFGQIVKLASYIATLSDSVLNVLPISANDVGAHLVNFLPSKGKNVAEMMQEGMKAFITLGVEIEHDMSNKIEAIQAINNAEFVLNLTAFDSEAQREYSDVMLPIASFAETAGTFVNATGLKQSFKMAVKPQGDAKAAWKIFRVLGNMLEMDGFEQTHSNQVFAEITDSPPKLDINNISLPTEIVSVNESAEPVSIYSVDALVRRSPSLQASIDNVSSKSLGDNYV